MERYKGIITIPRIIEFAVLVVIGIYGILLTLGLPIHYPEPKFVAGVALLALAWAWYQSFATWLSRAVAIRALEGAQDISEFLDTIAADPLSDEALAEKRKEEEDADQDRDER